MDKRKLGRAIDFVHDKVDFHCKKRPGQIDCDKCAEACKGQLITWTCHHDLRFFKAGLKLAGVKDNDEYLQWARAHGGYCDCEILFNAAEHLPK